MGAQSCSLSLLSSLSRIVTHFFFFFFFFSWLVHLFSCSAASPVVVDGHRQSVAELIQLTARKGRLVSAAVVADALAMLINWVAV